MHTHACTHMHVHTCLVTIIFSSGRCLDATEEIDLINVAFEQQTQSSSK